MTQWTFLFRSLPSFVFALLFLILSSCSHQPYLSTSDSSAMVTQILDQVNDAIVQTKSTCGESPEITSVQVDLQLGTTTSSSIGLPFAFLFPIGQSSEDRMQKMSLTFTPKPEPQTSNPNPHNKALTTVIEQIYLSAAKANPHYQFQNGSVQIQCTLESGISATASSSSSSGGSNSSSGSSSRTPQQASSSSQASVVLVPLQVGASSSNQSIQTITLNFGPRSKALTTGAVASAVATPTNGQAAPAANVKPQEAPQDGAIK